MITVFYRCYGKQGALKKLDSLVEQQALDSTITFTVCSAVSDPALDHHVALLGEEALLVGAYCRTLSLCLNMNKSLLWR